MKLFHKAYGDSTKPALFILHGLFGMLDNWHQMANRYTSDFYVITLDQRNHGQSPHDPEMNYDLMAGDLLELMTDLDIAQASLIGHSMGGKTVMKFALDHPEKVNKLLVADIAPRGYKPGHLDLFDAMFTLPVDTLETRSQAEQIISRKISGQGIQLFLLKNLARKSGGGFYWKLDLKNIWDAYPVLIGEISGTRPFNGPTLFVKGELSNYISPEDETEIKTLFPDAVFETIPNAGHWVHSENPEDFFQVSYRFLSA